MKPVDKYSKGYELARFWVRSTFKHLFYRSWEVRGLEKIERGKPYLFAPNHQNALMDALHLVILTNHQPIFLARADIFKKKFVARILNWMKIMPVYRIRDGFDSLQKNQEIFQKSAEVLAKGKRLVIFPEGNHGNKRNLRILKKGLARVAFGAEVAAEKQLDLEVVPVGIDYSDYEKFRSRVTITVGDPIAVKDFVDIYKEDQQKGLRSLNEEISTRLKPLMIEIPWQKLYDGVMGMRTLYGGRFAAANQLPYQTTFERFDSDKQLINKMGQFNDKEPEKAEKLAKKTATYFKLLSRSKIRDHVLENAPYSVGKFLIDSFGLLMGLPLFLYGFLNHVIIFAVPDRLSRKLIKDRAFRSSVAYVLGFVVLLPIMYIIQAVVVQLVFDHWLITLLYLLTLVPLGLFAIHYSFLAKKTFARIIFTRQLKKKNKNLLKLIELRHSLIAEMDQITV